MHKLCLSGFLFLALVSTPSLGLAQCTFPEPASSSVLNYSFEPVFSGKVLSLRVTLEFYGGASGHATLKLPSEWAGQKHAEKSVTELTALSSGTKIANTKSPAARVLRFRPYSTVRISYVLVKDWEGRLDSGTRFRADLSAQYFHIIGTTSLVHPEIDVFRLVDVHFDWQKLPASWALATSFGIDDRCQSFHGLWRDALNSLFVGGDYRIYRTNISGNALDFAIRGSWNFSDDAWISQARRIVEFERTFWHDNSFPYFLITLTPLDQDRGSNGGTALTNAFMEHLSRQDELTPNILGILAHETFHAWNPYRMGFPEGSEYSVSWFFEGFTRYYQDVMLFRAGVVSLPEYVAGVNEVLKKYHLSEGTQVSLNEFVRRHSVKHSDLDQLDYRRGAVLALWLDATIRRHTHNQASLDNVMFDLVAQQRLQLRNQKNRPVTLSNKRIFRTAAQRIDDKSAQMLREYVEQGGRILIPDNALGPCVQSRVEDMTTFDLGFDASRLNNGNKIVTDVVTYGEAYRAGLRDGQELVRWSVYNGDPSKEVRLTVKNAEGEQVITYFPRGTRIPVQQFNLDAGKYQRDPQACVPAN